MCLDGGLTTENARNIYVACKVLGLQHLNWFGHKLAVQKGLLHYRIKQVLCECRQFLATFSYNGREEIVVGTAIKESSTRQRLNADVKIRWESYLIWLNE